MIRVVLLSLLMAVGCSTSPPAGASTAPTQPPTAPTQSPTMDAPTSAPTTALTTPPASPPTSPARSGGDSIYDYDDDYDYYGPPATAGPATSQPSPAPPTGSSIAIGTAVSDELGAYLVGPDGLALYVFAEDSGDTSACTGSCAESWPALELEEGAALEASDGVDGQFGTITRNDGAVQVTYDGAPLYYYEGDAAPGDTNGHGIAELWFVAAP